MSVLFYSFLLVTSEKFHIFALGLSVSSLQLISVGSSSGNIILNEGVATEHINVKTMSGDLKTNATVSNVSVTSMSGDVELCIDAIQNVGVDVCTMSGEVLPVKANKEGDR